MKQLIISIALKLLPEEGKLRSVAKRIYARLFQPRTPDAIHPILSKEERIKLRDAVKIGFIGDLILLRDMVELGKKGDEYNFESIFSSMHPYFTECDLMTGVLEGPLSGDILGYTTANYEDGRALRCGYPDNFLYAIKKAGINFVTIANNHLFDKGREGMERTISQLEANAMPYVGYGKHLRTVVTVKNLRIAILSFNFAFNGKKDEFFFERGNEDLPHLIRPKNNRYYKKCLEIVKADFEWAKKQKPNCILVYPHIGDQFRHKPDENQLHWFKIFRLLGADIILGCHSHATQPLRFEDKSLCLYCPGNFVNNYFPHDGDASAMTEIYLDQDSGKPFAAAIVPIMAYSKRTDILRAEPIHELVNNPNLSWHDWFRLNDVHKIVTSSMLGIPIPVHQTQKRFIIWNDNKYRRFPYEKRLDIDNDCLESAKRIFEDSATIVFIGDSITEGTKNGGYGWFEPLMASISPKNVLRFALGGDTSKGILAHFGTEISNTKADLFCIAIGCNDIRYREKSICAMTAEEYRDTMDQLVKLIKSNNQKAVIILIAPWWSDDVFDSHCAMDCATKHSLYQAYTASLEEIAKNRECLFVDPNLSIWNKIYSGCQSQYLVDWIHPNAADGICLFSKAFIHELSKML